MKVKPSRGSVVEGPIHFAVFVCLFILLFPRGQTTIPTVPQGIGYRPGDKSPSVSSQGNTFRERRANN